MKCKIFGILLAAALVLSSCGQNKKDQVKNEKSFFAMDTYITVTSYSGDENSSVNATEEKIKRLEKLWSVTDKDSEIYKINHSEESSVEVSGETARLIRFALDMSKRTDGALDISLYPVLSAWGFITGENRVPGDDEIAQLLKNTGCEKIKLDGNKVSVPDNMQIDLGAVAKGYTGDIAVKILKENGVDSALLDLGGNIQTIGLKPDGSKWKIGIRNPFGEGSFGTLEIGECAVVTSGGYERYFEQDGETYWHILDPETGKPARNGVASVTVVGKEGGVCDALSTSLFVMGLEKAEKLWRQSDDFDMILVDDRGEIYVTEGIEKDFSVNENLSSGHINIIKR